MGDLRMFGGQQISLHMFPEFYDLVFSQDE